MVGVYGCTIDENIPRFVLARSSLFLLDISYVIGYAMLKEPSKKLLFVPEIRYIGSLVLAIAGSRADIRYHKMLATGTAKQFGSTFDGFSSNLSEYNHDGC
ncbi:unnamed protein product [Toxocara canis]|uniref:Proton_antipo_M domain-containing protein n=1 Tax=Toxocara canis TaxID=6265 RepID=A0A183UKS2_TOXCA|nr:unnamed protein product [Toxocara canis]